MGFSSGSGSFFKEHCLNRISARVQSRVSTLQLCKSRKHNVGLIIPRAGKSYVWMVFMAMWNRWQVKKWPPRAFASEVFVTEAKVKQALPGNSKGDQHCTTGCTVCICMCACVCITWQGCYWGRLAEIPDSSAAVCLGSLTSTPGCTSWLTWRSPSGFDPNQQRPNHFLFCIDFLHLQVNIDVVD